MRDINMWRGRAWGIDVILFSTVYATRLFMLMHILLQADGGLTITSFGAMLAPSLYVFSPPPSPPQPPPPPKQTDNSSLSATVVCTENTQHHTTNTTSASVTLTLIFTPAVRLYLTSSHHLEFRYSKIECCKDVIAFLQLTVPWRHQVREKQ